MVDWLCFKYCKISRTSPDVVTSIVANGYHNKTPQESSPNQKVVIAPLDERRLSLGQIRFSFHSSPRVSGRSVSMIRIAYRSDASSIELIEQNHGRSDVEVPTLYSSSTGDSQKNNRFVSYPRVTPKSTSNFSAVPTIQGVSQGRRSLSNNLEVSALYSSSTGDYSQRKELFVSYPRVSPNSTSNFSSFWRSGSKSVLTELIEKL